MRRDVFQAIADPTRRAIINLLISRPLTITAVAESFGMSRQAVTKHIRILAESGLLIIRQQGRERYCEVKLDQLTAIDQWLGPLRERWQYHFGKLDHLLTTLKNNT